MTDPRVRALQQALRKLGGDSPIVIEIPKPTDLCCGDPKNLDGNAHPWQHVSEDGPGDVYRCPECGAIDVD